MSTIRRNGSKTSVDPLGGYQARDWVTYPIPAVNARCVPLESVEHEFEVCGVDSEKAARCVQREPYNPARMFFYDYEQIAAGRDVHGIGQLSRLTEPCSGHPAGALASVSYEGTALEPPEVTLFIERTAEP